MFMWRELSEALAAPDCLISHGLQVDRCCKVCQIDDETVNHSLFECSIARNVWLRSNVPAPPQDFSHSLFSNMDFMLSLMEKEGLHQWLKMAI
ncbi:hypothetical protein V5N11_020898 [Cardamine amara subsp. amara]|uniref:Reverse transcriptase zinc-binding domain-containing protein n=1 Tax=Cardamine amara subsp. amara TaxID=228776 RepID=A0ABD0Z8A5_CARAN